MLAGLGAGAGVWSLLGRRAPQEALNAPVVRVRGHVTAEVLNGSGRLGLARVATRALRKAGVDVVYFGTADDSVRETEVLARRGDVAVAARIAKVLGAGRIRVATDTLLRVDVTVRLGVDYRPPPGVRP